MTEEEEIKKCLNCKKPECNNCREKRIDRTTDYVYFYGERIPLHEACKKLEITVGGFRSYKARYDLTMQETLDHFIEVDKEKKVFYKGRRYSMGEAAAMLGIRENTFRSYRVKRNITAQELFDEYLGGKQ